MKNYDKEVSLILEQWSGSVHRCQSHRQSPEHLQIFWPAHGQQRRRTEPPLKKPSGTQVRLVLHPILTVALGAGICLQPVGPSLYLTLSNNFWLVGSGPENRQHGNEQNTSAHHI